MLTDVKVLRKPVFVVSGREEEGALVVADDAEGVGEGVEVGKALLDSDVEGVPIAVAGGWDEGGEVVGDAKLDEVWVFGDAVGVRVFEEGVVGEGAERASHADAVGAVDDSEGRGTVIVGGGSEEDG